MKEKRAILWLRIAFILGAVTDAVAVAPMISAKAAGLLWGFEVFDPQYRFAIQMGAALMAAWTLLLIWACFKPLERRMIAPMTQLIVVCLVIAQIIAIQNGVLALDKALLSFIIQGIILAVYTYAFIISRSAAMQAVASDKE